MREKRGRRLLAVLVAGVLAVALLGCALYTKGVQRAFQAELRFPEQVRLSVWRWGQEREITDPDQKAELLKILTQGLTLKSILPPPALGDKAGSDLCHFFVWSNTVACYVPVTVPGEKPDQAFLGGRDRTYAITGGEALLNFANTYF